MSIKIGTIDVTPKPTHDYSTSEQVVRNLD